MQNKKRNRKRGTGYFFRVDYSLKKWGLFLLFQRDSLLFPLSSRKSSLSPLLTWIIHGSSLPDCHAPLATTMLFKIYVRRMRGTGYAAVVLHRKCPVTKQTSLRGAKKIPSLCSEQASNLMFLANHHEIVTLCSR